MALAFLLYAPALNGAFVFDDRYLPFLNPGMSDAPLRYWLGVRQLLMFTYWVNFKISGLEPFSFHALNVVLHAANSLLMFGVLRHLLALVDESGARRSALAGIGAAIFLAHPVQTEAVAYVASRSEVLSVFFFLLAFLLYLRQRGRGVTWGTGIIVLLLFGAGVSSKEHVIVLPALLVLTDLFWSRLDGVRRNLKLYIILVGAALLAAYPILAIIRNSPVIGFRMQDLTWYQYLFTQFRTIWIYVRLYLLPAGLNVDYDMPVSRTLFDHFAVLGFIGIIASVALAWGYRNRYPLAVYGSFVFLLLLTPTSSVVPIRDVIAERRLYLPFIGLLLITLDLVRRLHWSTTQVTRVAAAVVAVLGILTFARNQVWADPLSLWRDAVAKSPNKVRPRFQLAQAQMSGGNCAEAVEDFAAAARVEKPTFDLLLDWALALDCAGRTNEAIAKLHDAEKLERSGHLYATLGMMLGKQGKNQEALDALAKAEAADASFGMTYVYRGNVYMQLADPERALAEYQRAVTVDPRNEDARRSLAIAQQQLHFRR